MYNSQKCYNPNGYLTVDEQLFPTKVRCRFIQFLGNKPDKFGIKFWVLADVKSKYICNTFPYLGKDEERPMNQPLGEYVATKLLEPYLQKGYVTMDNTFTSKSLAEYLIRKTRLCWVLCG